MGKKKNQTNGGDTAVDATENNSAVPKGKKSRRNREEFDLTSELENVALETGVEAPVNLKRDDSPKNTENLPAVEPKINEGEPNIKTETKKGKKNRRKGQEEDNDDLLAQLEAEMNGVIPKADLSSKVTNGAGNNEEETKSKNAKGKAKAKDSKTKNEKKAAPEPKVKKEVKGKKNEEKSVTTEKKEEEQSLKKKKGPGSKMLEQIRAQQARLKENEEKSKREAEEEKRKEDERIRKEKERLRIEAEKKEAKKQKRKEQLKRQREEGKLLTKAQKLNRERAKTLLATVTLPEPDGEARPKKPYSRRKPSKPKEQEQVSGEQVEETIDETQVEEEEIAEESDDGVREAWDIDSSSDEESEVSEETVTEEKAPEDTKESISSDESSDSDHMNEAERRREKAKARMAQRKIDHEKNKDPDDLRAPVVCVLGHVDHGKTKILDKLRRTNVQEGEVGGITQQIGATNVPSDAVRSQTRMVKDFQMEELQFPGLLIIDTPGHQSFSNLRSRGSSLCDIAILVIDITQGLEPQTIESINLLKNKKTPFLVALNKVDRVFEWESYPTKDIREIINMQSVHTKNDFDKRTGEIIQALNIQGLNAALFWENPDPRTYVSLIPTSAISGDGMGNLIALVCQMCQKRLHVKLQFTEELQCTVLEVKAIQGHGTTIDVILINGRLKEGRTIVLAGTEGPIVTQIRSLLLPKPLKEIRVKGQYDEFKEIKAAQGIKIAAKDLEKAIAGLNLSVAYHDDEVDFIKEEVDREFKTAMRSIKVKDKGVYVQASTLGALEALLEFFKDQKIPYSGIRIGPVVKRDVMKAAAMLEHDPMYAVILAFDVKVEKDAQELADKEGVRIFSRETIYNLGDCYVDYLKEYKKKKQDELQSVAVFPCRLKIVPDNIYNKRDPIVVGVHVESGLLRCGTPLCVPSKENLDIGVVVSMEFNNQPVDLAKAGVKVCIKIQPLPGHTPELIGRHFDATDQLVSKISREGIDACKAYFRDDLSKTDWKLMAELKRQFQIL